MSTVKAEDRLKIVTPAKIDRYVFHETIGEGAFALVKLVQDIRTKEFFACKVIPRARLENDGIRTRFEMEVRAHQKAHHPGVVCLFNLLRDEANYYVIMEYCAEGDLAHAIVDRGSFCEDDARPLVRQILEIIHSVHRAGVCHRDLKPQNILFQRSGYIKLTDFGLATFLPENGLLTTPCGSLGYTSPECLAGGTYDGSATDLWAVGVIAFAIVTGRLPWTEHNQARLLQQIAAGRYNIPKTVSRPATSFIRGLMSVDPRERMTAEQAFAHPWLNEIPPIYPNVVGACRVTVQYLNWFFDEDSEEAEIMEAAAIKRVPSMEQMEVSRVAEWLDGRFVISAKLPKLMKLAPSTPDLVHKPGWGQIPPRGISAKLMAKQKFKPLTMRAELPMRPLVAKAVSFV
jgi:serine/threonine protein kinase